MPTNKPSAPTRSPSTAYDLPSAHRQLRVAIVCDWLTTMGGAERVVPNSDIRGRLQLNAESIAAVSNEGV